MKPEANQLELFREDYRLRERVSAKARHIRIEVRPSREVVLVYPRWVPRIEAIAFLRSREAWIRAKLAELAQQAPEAPPAPQWDGRDELPLRGRLLPVTVAPARLRRASVRIEEQRICIFAPSEHCAEPRRLQLALLAALQQQARLDAQRYLDEEAARLGLRWRELRLRDPRTLWGSCTQQGAISLSWRLVMAPPAVFRYVVVHELCHLVHMNHSQRFWSLVAQQMPDYEAQRRWLSEQGHLLHRHLPAKAA
ncbi:hypothetical protein SAMN04488038_112112 [Solimonas aquatica]|uniref:YgjP-like metallopeptidase domain-containing protein n=1 Tax=Solimonas aquatica TaxID=489703 RepID=A0A1H9JWZ4_9GAMM|nr:SprT family zinc-dependent metalloprotease [Solimonas aquatica]SEQ91327.1 hypothetical protein SAMN04488038_112112 [Solimonas aquatica]